MKKIAILGSTGSIGTMCLEVIDNLKNYEVVAISSNNNTNLLKEQIIKYKPRHVVVYDEKAGKDFYQKEKNLIKKYNVDLDFGLKGLNKIASLKLDMVLVSVVGAVGLLPVISAIKAGNNVALANKEPLVIAGNFIMKEAKKNKVKILPVDSEHSAIFQCLLGENIDEVYKLIITASGGPFYKKSISELEKVKVADALKHPRWKMGKKITIDSATLMNKGLEIIEAHHLFGIDIKNIQVLIHPESIIHSMVEFIDGTIKAHLGPTDMRHAIQFALSFPNRKYGIPVKLDFSKIKQMNFNIPNLKNFPCLRMAISAGEKGGTYPVVLNAANEVAVSKFLNEQISFCDIPKIIDKVLNMHKYSEIKTIEDILYFDKWARVKSNEVKV